MTQITDQFFVQRREQFPNYYYEEQAAYYDLPKNERGIPLPHTRT